MRDTTLSQIIPLLKNKRGRPSDGESCSLFTSYSPLNFAIVHRVCKHDHYLLHSVTHSRLHSSAGAWVSLCWETSSIFRYQSFQTTDIQSHSCSIMLHTSTFVMHIYQCIIQKFPSLLWRVSWSRRSQRRERGLVSPLLKAVVRLPMLEHTTCTARHWESSWPRYPLGQRGCMVITERRLDFPQIALSEYL